MMDINPKFHSRDTFMNELSKIIPILQNYNFDVKEHLNTGVLGKIIPSIKD